MKIGFVINALKTEHANYTTVGLGHTANAMGHEVWFITVGDFSYHPNGSIGAHGRTVRGSFENQAKYLHAIRSCDAIRQRIDTAELDVLLLRHDPAEETKRRPWAQHSPILFGQLAASAGTLVLNDPFMLATALNKTYFQQFPEIVRPRTLISRKSEEIRTFIHEQGGNVVLKPLQGSGGKNVFVVKNGDLSNLNQIIEVIAGQGYVVAQEYLSKAAEGDVRLFVINGEPLKVGGRCAAIRRINKTGDIRSNLHAGGEPQRVEVTDEMLRIVDAVSPKLLRDGMFLVGLDIVGDKLMEVNVFSPGGLNTISRAYKADFMGAVIRAIEQRSHAHTGRRV